MKRGRKLNNTRRASVVSKWPVMRWYTEWSDYVRRQKRFKRFLLRGAPSLYVVTAELGDFDRRHWPTD